MDHDLIVEQVLERCKHLIENILQAPDLHSVATASLVLFAPLREVAREILQAKVALEAQQRRSQDVPCCCLDVHVTYVQTLLVIDLHLKWFTTSAVACQEYWAFV
jgi:hypothetical protein